MRRKYEERIGIMRNKAFDLLLQVGGIILLVLACILFCLPPEQRPVFRQFMFNVDERYEKTLDKGEVESDLRSLFKDNYELSQNLSVKVKQKGNRWTIRDKGKNNWFSIIKEQGVLNLYEDKPWFKDYAVHLGLDLQGGSELVYSIDVTEGDGTRSAEDVVQDTIGVISQRIYESGIVREPRINAQGTDRILIQLPGLNQSETKLIQEEIQRLGTLEFRLVSSPKVGDEVDEAKEREEYRKLKERARTSIGERYLSEYAARLRSKGYKWYPSHEVGGQERLLFMKDGYDFAGEKFRRFWVGFSGTGKVIFFELKQEHKTYFDDFTGKYKGELLAIVFNNKIMATPTIKDRIPGEGILQGFSPEDIDKLMKVLKSGSLEIQPELLSENTIGPSLGEDSIRLGLISGLVGLGIVILFMIFYYLAAGLIACLALAFNIIIIFAVLVAIKETLTLPGIAGMILTVGMSVDANIIIFERIREEQKRKRDVLDAIETKKRKKKQADETTTPAAPIYSTDVTKQELYEYVSLGYDKAFWTIFDANVTTFLTAVILYVFASGPVQGFAFTLGVGILASFFTAIVVTRVFLHLIIEMGTIRTIRMVEWVRNPKFAFSRSMRAAGSISLALIVGGLLLFFSRYESYFGLDLKGGVLAQVSLDKPLPTAEVRKRMADEQRLEVQSIATDVPKGSNSTGWYEFSLRLPNLNQADIDKINRDLLGVSAKIRRTNDSLKVVNGRYHRTEEELRREKRDLRQLTREKADRENIEAARQAVERIQQRVDELKKERAKFDKYLNGPFTLEDYEIKDVTGFLASLKNAKDPASIVLSKELSPETSQKLAAMKGEPAADLVAAVVKDINQALQKEVLFANYKQLFPKLDILSSEARERIRFVEKGYSFHPEEKEEATQKPRINRLLLQAAYPNVIEETDVKGEKSWKVFLKNKLAGIEQLRKKIEGRFEKELSPVPFGTLSSTQKIRHQVYHEIALNTKIPVTAKFIQETLQNVKNLEKIEVASRWYEAQVKFVTKPKDEQEIIDLLKAPLSLATSIDESKMKVELKKGTQEDTYAIRIEFDLAIPGSVVRKAMSQAGFASYDFTLVDAQGSSEYKTFDVMFHIPTDVMAGKSQEELQHMAEKVLRDAFADVIYKEHSVYLSDPFPRFTQIAGVVARAQQAKAWQAIFLSFIALLFYIAYRFFPNGMRFGVGAVVALIHDVAITIGAIALFSYLGIVNVEINLDSIAAILTLIGYSLNDTIVIFDRLRENQRKNEVWDRLPKAKIAEEYNASLNQTLSRTLLTSLTTLFVLVSIFLFNFGKGSAMESFSFILIVGVVVGTYSSIFIASYYVLALDQRSRV